ncbi:NrfD/PsrC family molybdoenzyme membrane anchor subunit [Adlercreutzia caecimuris]|uniref:NrfD/PsrC family molybdoenzyme membrane anchor subunit n=1 Tax=Adlercreutzia caecimuris TaxID=671266 RepID=UPI001455015D|nr:NrfD/PsrC family molybdoenzyme membrane anchor subunit [Adlercreutzia caecimuris]MCI9208435.1 polysulfide reductase NrfD [Adlercreutzia caecimuris]
MFSELAIAYLFFGGTGAGACVVLGLLECANIGRYGMRPAPSILGLGASASASSASRLGVPAPSRRAGGSFAVPHELMARGWSLGLLFLATGALCLMADLGRPERMIALWIAPRPTVVTLGAWALLITLLAATFFAVAANGDCSRMAPGLVLAVAAVAVIAGAVTTAYTGVLLGSLPSVVAFASPLVPVLFCLSSLSCGVAVVFAAASFVNSRSPFGGALRRLARIDGVLIGAEGAALALYAAHLFAQPATLTGAWALVQGEMAVLFWVVLVAGGLVAPLILERRYPAGDRRVKGLWIAFCVLLGGVALRLCVTDLAAFDLSQMPELAFGLVALPGT